MNIQDALRAQYFLAILENEIAKTERVFQNCLFFARSLKLILTEFVSPLCVELDQLLLPTIALEVYKAKQHGYGWIKYIDQKECEHFCDIQNFYRRMGVLLSVADALNYTDGHCENLIAHGAFPILLDGETFFQNYPIAILRQKNILSTLLIQKNSLEKNHFPASALQAPYGIKLEYIQTHAIHDHTDELEIRYFGINPSKHHHCPILMGSPYYAYDYVPFIVEGYCTSYKKITNRVETILDNKHWWDKASQVQARVVRRETMAYLYLLRKIQQPEWIASRKEAAAFLLEQLGTKPYSDYEISDLLTLNIPYFYHLPGQKHFYDGREREYANVFEISAFPLFFVGLWCSMLLADIVLAPVIAVVRLHLNEKILSHCNLLLMEKANTIQSLGPFENQKFYDQMQFLKNESSRRPLNFIYVLTGFSKEAIALVSVFFVLSSLGWWIPLAMLIASFPHAASILWFEKKAWDQLLFQSPESRKLAWIASLPLDERAAKEVRLFGFGGFLIDRYKNLVKGLYSSHSKERWKKSIFSLLLSSLTVIGNIAIISAILFKAKSGALQIGGLVIAIQALVMTQSQLAGCISYCGMSTPIFLFFDKLKLFLNSSLCPMAACPVSTLMPPSFQEIRFENVSFCYPDGRNALSKVNCVIRKGEKIAIVGENGAGKSTFVKLLCRFYDPSEGVITIDGIDLKSINITKWRSSISCIFQDFGQYPLTVSENIALGDINASAERISHAAKKGGFNTVLNRLPAGLKSPLGKEFGGTSLSGGEWQKLGMSRAFVREANLLILDEPTSALDPESECDVFRKFGEHSQDKTTLFITHRLGSVKMADRILVFKNGCLIEEGHHGNLLMAQGEYAALFSLQADQYKNIHI